VFQCLSLQSHSHFSGGFYDGLHWYSPCTLIETPGGNLNLLALLMVISHLCWILGCKLGYLAIVNGKYSHSTIKKLSYSTMSILRSLFPWSNTKRYSC
jgi:hypothetical protein